MQKRRSYAKNKPIPLHRLSYFKDMIFDIEKESIYQTIKMLYHTNIAT